MTEGTLYIVSTPIGNLEDITLRGLRILKEVGLIAAEDTRHTRKLLSRYDIHTPMTSFFEAREVGKSDELVRRLKEGENIALVSDAGTPAISDPGYRLVRLAVEAGIKVEAIPGPSAVISALAVAGLPTDQFIFVGFLPDKEGRRRKKLEELRQYDSTLVFYVSKWKIEKTLSAILEILGNRKSAICRELTKIHEEILRGDISNLLEMVKGRELKGEITLIVSGEK